MYLRRDTISEPLGSLPFSFKEGYDQVQVSSDTARDTKFVHEMFKIPVNGKKIS